MNFCFCLVLYRLEFDEIDLFFFICRVSTNMSLLSTWLKTALVLSLTLRKSWRLGLKCSLVVKWEADPSKVFIYFHFSIYFFFFKKKTLQNTHWYLLYHICYFDLLSFDETFWREKISTGCILKTKWLLKKMKIVIKRENLCAFENANFHQLFVLEGS